MARQGTARGVLLAAGKCVLIATCGAHDDRE
jgi:hypothetical protein